MIDFLLKPGSRSYTLTMPANDDDNNEDGAFSRRLSILLEATADLNNMLTEPERLYENLLELLNRAVPFYSGSVQVMEGDSATIVAYRGDFNRDVVMGLRFHMDPLFPNYRVVTTKQPVAFADIREEYPHFYTRQDEFNSGHIRSWLGVPMVVSGTVIGMLALDRNVVDPFDDEDIRIVQAFANNAAVAIRNSGTYLQLQEAHAAGNALMREMNHRVKNSLQLVSSLIDIHSGVVSDESTRQSLAELQVRIESIASIHERLYKRSDMRTVDLDLYLGDLARDVLESFTRADGRVELSLETCPMPVDASLAVTLGLITTEIVMNALKYAFPGAAPGTLTLGLRRVGDGAELLVADNGIGMGGAKGRENGFGVSLVRNLAIQLRGQAVVESRPGRTAWTIRFPLA